MPKAVRVCLEALPENQKKLWRELQQKSAFLDQFRFYLAGGTALSLQIAHRQSLDFDFFSQKIETAEAVRRWLEENFNGFVLRDMDRGTIHAEVEKTKVSFIGGYGYPLVAEPVQLGKVQAAGITDIAAMKLLAISHRATLRDYLDLAAIIRDHVALSKLLELSRKKYGKNFNVMVPVKALVSFHDVEMENPVLLDKTLADSWQSILKQAVREIAKG